MTNAAIAIGSNSTRLLALDASGRALRARAETKLMLGILPDGNISREAMDNTAQAVLALKTQALAFGASTVTLYATSATRDARNGEEFARIIKAVAGLELNVIPGEREAQLAFKAASRGEHCAVIDIGGGSTETTFGAGEHIFGAVSAQLGASRLMKEGLISSLSDARRTLKDVRVRLEAAYGALLALARPPRLFGIGGTCTTAAAIHKNTDSHGEELEDTHLTLDEVRAQLEMLAPMKLEQRALVRGLYPSRVLIMPHGLCILIAAMELFGFEELTVSVRNNLDALIMEKE